MASPSSETKYTLLELATEVVTIIETIKTWDKLDTELLKRLSYLINEVLSETPQNQENLTEYLIEAINERNLINATIDYASILAKVRNKPKLPITQYDYKVP